jgi:hypothetical protein
LLDVAAGKDVEAHHMPSLPHRMWELLTGKEPWDGLNYHALLHQMSTNKALRPPLPGE